MSAAGALLLLLTGDAREEAMADLGRAPGVVTGEEAPPPPREDKAERGRMMATGDKDGYELGVGEDVGDDMKVAREIERQALSSWARRRNVLTDDASSTCDWLFAREMLSARRE
jgi:hypothetical protein